MAFTPGQQLQGGKYTIDRQLGKGRFGMTYLARDRKGENVVIKTIADDLLNQLTPQEIDKVKDKFWQEAFNLARCKHPNIVRVIEIFKEGQLPCIAMEYIAGKDLADLTTKIWSESEALNCIRQICEALIVVHENNLVHRDVKPANIMLRDRNAVLIDFGLTRGFDNPLTTINPATADGYAPLELYHADAERGAYTDVYSLAATLYFLLTKQVPPSAIDRSFSKAKLVPPKQINPQISDKINDGICTGMALGAEDRSQTIREWLDLLGLKRWKLWPQPPWLVIVEILGVVALIFAILNDGSDLWRKIFSPQSPAPTPQVTPKN